jgi:hypothetical protein
VAAGHVVVEQTVGSIGWGGAATAFEGEVLAGGKVTTEQQAESVEEGGTLSGVKVKRIG